MTAHVRLERSYGLLQVTQLRIIRARTQVCMHNVCDPSTEHLEIKVSEGKYSANVNLENMF